MQLSLFKALVGTALVGTALGAAVPQDPDTSAVWQPAVGSSHQIILTNTLSLASGQLTPDVDVYDLDLFDTDVSIIQGLKAKGKKVICYFSGKLPLKLRIRHVRLNVVQLVLLKIGERTGRRFQSRTRALACLPGPASDGSMSAATPSGPSCRSALRSRPKRDVMPSIPTTWVSHITQIFSGEYSLTPSQTDTPTTTPAASVSPPPIPSTTSRSSPPKPPNTACRPA